MLIVHPVRRYSRCIPERWRDFGTCLALLVTPLLLLEFASISPDGASPPSSTHSTLSSVYKKARLTSCSLYSRMPLTLHATRRSPHGASRLVQALSAWSVKTQRAPSSHCRDASVYSHTKYMTKAMHGMTTPPCPLNASSCA